MRGIFTPMSELPTWRNHSLPGQVLRELRRGTDELKLAAVSRIERDLPWWSELSGEDRSWLGLVAHEGINRFLAWLQSADETSSRPQDIFRVAPRELTRTISLQRTLEVVRLITAEVEDSGLRYVPAEYRRDLYEMALIYSREVAFSAASIYARAAETRGQWDARLEASAIDAIMRGSSPSVTRSRLATLGWTGRGRTFALVGPAVTELADASSELRNALLRLTDDAVVGIQGDRLIAVLCTDLAPRAIATEVAEHFGAGSIVIGPPVDDVIHASRSTRAAFAAHAAIRALIQPDRIIEADDLLPERVLDGDPLARETMVEHIYTPMLSAGAVLIETLESYLTLGRSLEASARALIVHPNTVRYRLRRIAQTIGWDPTEPREGQILQIALMVGRLDAGGREV